MKPSHKDVAALSKGGELKQYNPEVSEIHLPLGILVVVGNS